MPSTENSGTSSPLAAFGRSIWSFRREQVHSMETNQDSSALESELEFFQQRVTERFQDLSSAGNDELLSIPWIQKLLDAFISSLEDFRVLLLKNKAEVSKPPLERLIDDFFERIVKGLDICNATRDGIEKIRSWHKLLDIVVCALDSQKRALSEGQFRRARKALVDLALVMLDERDSGSMFSHRNMSFGRHNTKKDHHSHHRVQSSGHSRSLSWSVSNSWSAAKQLQSIATNLVPPRGNEIVATNGLAVPVFTMSFVLMFVLWTLVAAIPCQDRSLNVHFSVPRNFSWGTLLMSLLNRILEESKKRENRNTNGLLREIYQVERCARHMTDLVDSVQFPLTEEHKEEVEQRVQEIAMVCESFRNGLDPLERQLREVFRSIMNCRTEGHDILNRGKNDLE
ncbi:protein BYPASS1-LIKE-like [Humulus lupulus]|uniref:protein BYPASS1-LIKE-like n=1 Tax=Humulus lupulus TaxID=3486 RepID=UPI002B402258|nr:protein BYPASS1-LIKE-like [Humulus lupulus]XP_062077250.1 protein BYPASS1-LIKE-like [Humulus lupulus]